MRIAWFIVAIFAFVAAAQWLSPSRADVNSVVSVAPYPPLAIPETATSGNIANNTAAATLATAAGKTTYITGFSCESGGATASADVDITVTGIISATGHYAFDSGTIAGAGSLIARTFSPPVPASAVNTTIVVSMPALGSGNTNATCNASGFQF